MNHAKVKILCYLLLIAIALTAAEPPRRRPAPYPAAGWRPKKPFNLPGEYLPPADIELEPQQAVDVEIEKQRIDFAGQITERQPILLTPLKEQQNPFRYDLDFLNLNALPHKTQPKNFRPSTQEQTTQPQFFPTTPTTTTTTVNSPDAQFFPRDKDFAQPAPTYGAPNVINVAFPDPRTAVSVAEDEEQENREAIEALKTAIKDYNANKAKTNNDDDDDGGIRTSLFTRGQYFILGPDNTVQRVMFTTTQTDEEATKNGFTAELKYTPVGEIRDPVFKYNNEGQLVRVF